MYPSSQCNLFLTFSFSSRGLSSLPAVHYCDQSYAEWLEAYGRTNLTRGEKSRLAEEAAALEGAALIVCTCTHCAEFLKRHYGLSNVFGSPVFGMNLTGYTGDPHPPFLHKLDSTDILFIGSAIRKRGLDVLLEAFRAFNQSTSQTYTLHIVGFGDGAVPGGWPNTRWHGRLDKDVRDQAHRYWELLERACMFVIPSRTGPLPGVIPEAQYLGTPIITTRVWGADQLVEDGKTALVLEEATADAVQEAMSRLASDPDLRMQLARAGHKQALKWTWARAARTLVEQMERVAAGRSLDNRSGRQ
jgi:glycosyltransferase involved in cell wall biosynthesis